MPVNSVSGPNPDWMMNAPTLGSNSIIMGRGAEELGVNDFFNLLAAQLSNQDMFDPQSNTEFIAQMAQFTTLRGIQIIQEHQLASHAASHAGKHVTVAHTDSAGNLTRTEGIVSRVTFYDGSPMVVVNGLSFPLFSVMEVHDPNGSGPSAPPADDDDDDDTVSGPGSAPPPNVNDINSASALIGRTVTLRFRDEDFGGYVEVTGVVTGARRDPQGNILFTLDDGEDYSAAYLTAVRQTTGNNA